MSQITPVPGPSQADFDTLNGNITSLSDQIGTLNGKIGMVGKVLYSGAIGTSATSQSIPDLSKYTVFIANVVSSFRGGPAYGLRTSATEVRFYGASLASGGAVTNTYAVMNTNGDAFNGWDTDGTYSTKWGTNVTGISNIIGIA